MNEERPQVYARQPGQDVGEKIFIKPLVFLVFHYSECDNAYKAISYICSFRKPCLLIKYVFHLVLIKRTKFAYKVRVCRFFLFLSGL